MLLLHASFEKENVLIWAEKQFTQIPKISKRNYKSREAPPPIHPFSTKSEQLLQILNKKLKVEKDCCDKGLLWLPSFQKTPLPSNPIIGHIPKSNEKLKLSPWLVWFYSLKKEEILNLFFQFRNTNIFSPGVFFGPSFSYLNKIFFFIFSLIIRQKYLPSLKVDKFTFKSLWSPIFLGLDKIRLNQLEKAMPCLCRSLTSSIKQKKTPTFHPKKYLIPFITNMIDFIIRLSSKKNVFNTTKNIHDEWINKLKSKDNNLKFDLFKGQLFLDTVKEWQQPIKNTSISPFKLCLRLEEPEESYSIKKNIEIANSLWKVNYFIQAYDDPSLLINIEDIWNPKGLKRKVLDRSNFNTRQFILTSLGMALSICPHIESSLHSHIPTGFSLNSNEVITFLKEYMEKFEEIGIGVISPNWWKKDKINLNAKAFIESSFIKKNKSIWDSLNISWNIYLGNSKLSREELFQLALLKDPIIKMRGEWIILNKEELNKALRLLEKKFCQPKNPLDLLNIANGVFEKENMIPITEIKANGWIKEFLDTINGKVSLKILNVPQNFKGILRPYQIRGYSWICFLQKWQLGACLADDMGLGKTPQTLAMIMYNWEKSKKTNPFLLICPTSLLGNWKREVEKFTPQLSVHIHHGLNRKKDNSFIKHIKNKKLVITSYALLQRDEKFIQKIKWEGIILDEAQNIKNKNTKQTKSVYKLEGKYRLALTGTPIENSIGDLWSIMHFLNPGYLGSYEKFKDTFFKGIHIEKDPVKTSTLKELTTPLILRRLKTDRTIISDLPQKIEIKNYCALTSEQISLYENVVADANGFLEKAKDIERKGIIIATFSKLKQICNHPVNFLKDNSSLDNRSGKLIRLKELLEEVYSIRDHCLIFTQYAEMGHLLKKFIEGLYGEEVFFLYGQTSKKNRDFMIEQFQKDQGPLIFILSIKAGGIGLNLTKANNVFHFDRWWNPAVENQATDRAFRIGQKKNVQVYKFICSGTIEESIDELIEGKKELASNIIGKGESWLTELSTDRIKELWKLRKSTL
ncbi:MAG: hypothetical protein AMS24_04440 [Chlamydiae bacterium SM23_39]|nr:MAG: hypothetical protein AMS24_04440 [Chlamydiae bacterium SM23_39]